MMSKPDFLEKQILFIESNHNTKLKFKNSNLVLVDENNKTLLQHSLYRIFVVFIYGDFNISSVLIKSAKKYSISFIFLNYNLKPYFSILPDNKGNFLLRQKQYNNSKELDISKHIIKNKINNQIFLIKSLRYLSSTEKLALDNLKSLINKIDTVKNTQELLGIEGTASKIYFSIYFKNLDFKGRKPHCKTDIFNLLLDIGYFYLFNFIEANLEFYGFDTYCGFYHKFFFQRKSLICDIIEPFRGIVDKKIRKSYNLKQIDTNDFYYKNGQWYIKREFNKKYSELFLKEILLYKEQIFLYIQKYYRAFMKDVSIDQYPIFNIGDLE